ncbi:MAG: GAF domain-containing protein [Gammaproteobacteria bacterium]|nr:GAF domain-containing protein [Gammaproteobacteria bacterium]
MQNSKQYLKVLKTWCETHKPEVKYSYPVPLLGEGGTCSLFGELSEHPFDLTTVLTSPQLSLVAQCQSIVDWVQQQSNVDWFGIYITLHNNQDAALTKLAYFGEPSRAQFPLSKEFAAISNNTAVGLTGEKRVINNVQEFVKQGGEYYTCDPKVKSELCYPIVSNKNNNSEQQDAKILGIIDAESFSTDCFDQDQQALFSAVCEYLSERINKSENI